MYNKKRDLRKEMNPDVFELEERRIAREEKTGLIQDFENLLVGGEDIVSLDYLKGTDKIDNRFGLLK